VRIHEISDSASETKCWARYNVNFHCMIRGDRNEMMSIYSGVCRIYTPRHSVHLCYPCIFVQPPSLLEDVLYRACLRCTWRLRSNDLRNALGGRNRACLEMHLEAEVESIQKMHLEAVIDRVWRSTLWL